MDAARGADLVTTDVVDQHGIRVGEGGARRDFENWQVDADMMREAKKDALFMHCLPAHRGEEVAGEVIDGPQSVVWEEAENRLHTQKALMEFLLLARSRKGERGKSEGQGEEGRPRLLGRARYLGRPQMAAGHLWVRGSHVHRRHRQGEELEPARKKARKLGVKEIFVDRPCARNSRRDFVFPMFRANTNLRG